MKRAFIVEVELDIDYDGDDLPENLAGWLDCWLTMPSESHGFGASAVADLHGDRGSRVFEIAN